MAGYADGETINSILRPHDANGKSDYKLREEGHMLLTKCFCNDGCMWRISFAILLNRISLTKQQEQELPPQQKHLGRWLLLYHDNNSTNEDNG